MKTTFNISAYFKTQSLKRTLAQSNNESTILPFLHGLAIKHRKFASYVFVPDQADIKEVLKARMFAPMDAEVLKEDSILDIGTGVMYNKEYNWMFVLIDPKEWALVNTAIDIAENSTGSFESQCHIVLNANDILREKCVSFREPA